MTLTETSIKATIRTAIKTGTGGKKYDERGLYLLLKPQGERCGAWWRLKYRFGGKERGISLGVYPTVSLKRAREKRDEQKRLVSDGVNPSVQRQEEKLSHALTFELIAQEWLELQAKKLAETTHAKARWLLDFMIPEFGG